MQSHKNELVLSYFSLKASTSNAKFVKIHKFKAHILIGVKKCAYCRNPTQAKAFDGFLHKFKFSALSLKLNGKGIPKIEKETFKVYAYRQFLYNEEIRGKVVTKFFVDGFTKCTFFLLKVTELPELPTEMDYPSEKVSSLKKCLLKTN